MKVAALFVVVVAGLGACAGPAIDEVSFTGDDQECAATFSCGGATCGGVEYEIACTFNAANDIYDCSCTADGVEGETFSEAGVCETDANGVFTDFDFEDATAHAVEDCKFPLSIGADRTAE